MNELEKFRAIKTFIFDVDGVLTNSQLLVTEEGQLLRSMNVRDGYAIKWAIKQGYKVAIMTGGKSQGVVSRLENLGVVDMYYGVQDKVEAYREFMDLYEGDFVDEEVLFMGDDMVDLQVMRLVGLPCCPTDACPEVLAISNYVSDRPGGGGAARDVIERVLKLHGKWLPAPAHEDDLPTSV